MENLVSKNTMQDGDYLFCASKHLSQAYILAVESLQGYTYHRWLAVGHLGEAERETINEYKEFSDKIRNLRAKMMGQVNDGWSLQDITNLLVEARNLAVEHNGYSEKEHLFKFYNDTDIAEKESIFSKLLTGEGFKIPLDGLMVGNSLVKPIQIEEEDKKIISHALNQIFGSGVNMASNVPTPEQFIKEDENPDIGNAVKRHHEENDNKDEEEEQEPIDEYINEEKYDDGIFEDEDENQEPEEVDNNYISPC